MGVFFIYWSNIVDLNHFLIRIAFFIFSPQNNVYVSVLAELTRDQWCTFPRKPLFDTCRIQIVDIPDNY